MRIMPFSTLITALTTPTVFDVLFRWCSPQTLARVSKVCNGGREAVADYMKKAFNINRFLGKFFDDPVAFRQLQAQLQFIISGSQALQFMGRRAYPNTDLDLYTFPEDGPAVGKWLLEQGYAFVPYEPSQGPQTFTEALAAWAWQPKELEPGSEELDYSNLGIRAVWNFKKQRQAVLGATAEAMGSESLCVQVIIAGGSPVECVLRFHSSESLDKPSSAVLTFAAVVMNLITWNAAYSLYPLATFENNKGLILRRAGMNFEQAMEKYACRGWHLTGESGTEPGTGFHLGVRGIGDRFTWTIPLNTDGLIAPSPALADVVLLNSWELMEQVVGSSVEEVEAVEQGEVLAYRHRMGLLRLSDLGYTHTAHHQLIADVIEQSIAEDAVS